VHIGFAAGHNVQVPSAPWLAARCPSEVRSSQGGSDTAGAHLVVVRRTCYCRPQEVVHIAAADIGRLAWRTPIVQRTAPVLAPVQLERLSVYLLPLPVAAAGLRGLAACSTMMISNSLVEQKVA